MAITDPRVVKFSNEVVRPLAERLRDLFEDCARARQAWTDEISGLTPNDPAEILNDGRAAEGLSQLSGREIKQILDVAGELLNLRAGTTVTATTNVDAKIGKACVRALRT